jgi:hypothetical protein
VKAILAEVSLISPTPTSSSKCGGANDRFPPQAGQPASAEEVWNGAIGLKNRKI